MESATAIELPARPVVLSLLSRVVGRSCQRAGFNVMKPISMPSKRQRSNSSGVTEPFNR